MPPSHSSLSIPTPLTCKHSITLLALLAVASVAYHAAAHLFFYEPDSIWYLSLADNLAHHNGYRTLEGTWCADWPPLVPLLLVPARLLHLPEPVGFATVNAISIAAIVTVCGRWLARLTDNSVFIASALLVLIFSPPMLAVANSGYTECAFTAAAVSALYVLTEWRERQPLRAVCVSALLGAMAMLGRYLGVAVIISAVILIGLDARIPIRRRIAQAAVYCTIALAPIAVWCLVNHAHTGTFTGVRGPAQQSAGAVVATAVECILPWIGYGLVPALAWILIRRTGGSARAVFSGDTHACLALLIFPCLYVLMLLISTSMVDVDPPDDRLLAPAFPLAFVCLAALMSAAVGRPARTRPEWAIALGVWLVCDLVQIPLQNGPGYLDPEIEKTGLVTAIRSTPKSTEIYSNDAAACWFFGHHEAIDTFDGASGWTDAQVDDAVRKLDNGADFAWFDQSMGDADLPTDQLDRCRMLVPIKRFDDGVLYRINVPN